MRRHLTRATFNIVVDTDAARWNHNIHYHRVILDAVPRGCQRALDLGCGEGLLARRLRRKVPHVTAIDIDQASIDLARQQDPSTDIDYVLGDFFSHDFAPESFDLVASVAALHHMDAMQALGRMTGLLRPGGILAIVGIARTEFPRDLAFVAASLTAKWAHRLAKSYWEHSAPTVWPPPESFRRMRRIIRERLPGARYRRHLLWRYSVVWQKPGSGPS
jgi:2-polyprenyl-3-methyl-5-hydroxy-6-metoxy-1,4-benzoquinol methylase